MAMKTTLCFYGWCPKCRKMHYHPVHGIIDDSDLPQTCEDCGSEIIWEEAAHNHQLKLGPEKREKRGLSWLKSISPIQGFESCLLEFSILLLILIGAYLHLGVSQWLPLWRWVYIGAAFFLVLGGWVACRKFMETITDNTVRMALEEGRRQGRYLRDKEVGNSAVGSGRDMD